MRQAIHPFNHEPAAPNSAAENGRSLAISVASLVALGSASAWLYYWGGDLHRFIQWIAAYIGLFIGQFAIYLAACYVVFRFSDRLSRAATLAIVAIILVFAAAFRAQLVGKKPFLSTDTYRYIWDGRVQAAGINPYRHIPSAPELAYLREDKIYPQINRGDYEGTPYPPIAQAVYLLVYLAHPLSVTAFKVAMLLFDMIAAIAIMIALARSGMNPARAIVFAWHPLLIFEGAHSGYVESVFIAFLALAVLAWSYKKPALTGIALALATLVKFYPALLLPVFIMVKPAREGRLARELEEASQAALPAGKLSRLAIPAVDNTTAQAGETERRIYWSSALRSALLDKNNLALLAAFVATIIIAYLPYLGVGSGVFGSLPGEVKEEGFTGSGTRYFLLGVLRKLAPVPTVAFLCLAGCALLAMGIWRVFKTKRSAMDIASGSVALIGLYLFLTTPRYPWYYAWIIPFLCFVPGAGWLYLTGASVLLYLLWYTPLVYPDLPFWLGAVIYIPTIMMLVYQYWIKRRRAEDRLAVQG